jgi:hypothetical protein
MPFHDDGAPPLTDEERHKQQKLRLWAMELSYSMPELDDLMLGRPPRPPPSFWQRVKRWFRRLYRD